MTSMQPDPRSVAADRRVAIIGTGLIGTSIAMAATRAGMRRSPGGTSTEPSSLGPPRAARAHGRAFARGRGRRRRPRGGLHADRRRRRASVATRSRAAPDAIVDRCGEHQGARRETRSRRSRRRRRCPGSSPGHPMGGSERSGPEHASASVVDGIVWVLDARPTASNPARSTSLERGSSGSAPGRCDFRRSGTTGSSRSSAISRRSPPRSLMGLAADRGGGGAGRSCCSPREGSVTSPGWRRRTRRSGARSCSRTASQVASAIDLLRRAPGGAPRRQCSRAAGAEVERTFDAAKQARLAAGGEADRPSRGRGAPGGDPGRAGRPRADHGRRSATAGVNIEDLQIVHSPEGGRGPCTSRSRRARPTDAAGVLGAGGYDPIRLA